MLDKIRATADGAIILRDWLGEDMEPVSKEQASRRAAVCVECQQNVQGDWWSHSTDILADVIRKQLKVKEEGGAATGDDTRLGTCGICLCNLKLKVWCPIKHIENNTHEKTIDRMPLCCWIRQEHERNTCGK